MINILLNAGITGGIVVLLWIVSYPLTKKMFKSSWHYAVMKLAVIFMLIPLSALAPYAAPAIDRIYDAVFADVMSAKRDMPYLTAISEQVQTVSAGAETVNTALSDIVFSDAPRGGTDSGTDSETDGENGSRYATNFDIAEANYPQYIDEIPIDAPNGSAKISTAPKLPYLQIAWLTVAAVLFFIEVLKMSKFKKQILNSSSEVCDRGTLDLFCEYKKQVKARGRINLRISEYIKTPLAFGLVNPYVIIPAAEMSAEEKRLVFIHELTHIKNGDLWLKFTATFLSALHWFNPLVHILRRKISVVSEEYCDECVTKNMGKDERLLYGNLILKAVSDESAPQLCSTLSAPTKNLKRRLSNMLNLKKSRKGVVALSVIIAMAICSVAAVYALNSDTAVKDETVPTVKDEPAVIKEPAMDENITIDDTGTYVDAKSEEGETGSALLSAEILGEVVEFSAATSDEIYDRFVEYFEEIKRIAEKEYDRLTKTKESELAEAQKAILDQIEKERAQLLGRLDRYRTEREKQVEEAKRTAALYDEFQRELSKVWNSWGNFEGSEFWTTLWQTNAWVKAERDKMAVLRLKDGTEIVTLPRFVTIQQPYTEKLDMTKMPESLKSFAVEPSPSLALVIPVSKPTVTLTNGVIIQAPKFTTFLVDITKDADRDLRITVGNGTATITQPDGTSTTVPTGTMINGKGEVIHVASVAPLTPINTTILDKQTQIFKSFKGGAGGIFFKKSPLPSHTITAPPHTGMQIPVMNEDRLEARKRTAFAISWSVPRRRRGMWLEYSGAISECLILSLSLMVQPGATWLTVTPLGPTSFARTR